MIKKKTLDYNGALLTLSYDSKTDNTTGIDVSIKEINIKSLSYTISILQGLLNLGRVL